MNAKHSQVIILDGSEDIDLLSALAAGKSITASQGGTGLNAEARAMLQALYSRSPHSVTEHIKKVVERGATSFMGQYYVKYGHKSIGDCGFITIFVEGCSMLVAKAIQDTRLYNGQEASTRYLDFSVVPFLNPIGTSEGQDIIDAWRAFYERGTSDAVFRASLKERFPKKEGEKDDAYERAISARIFDIMRGFLPFSATTFVAWTVNLRQAADRLEVLRNHPLAEVRTTAEEIIAQLKARYPSSFSHEFRTEQDAYWRRVNELSYYAPKKQQDFTFNHSIDRDLLAHYESILANRPKHTEIPPFLEELGQVRVSFFLDGGSWRDLQRHRALIVRFPLYETRWGFYPWYLEQLTPELKSAALELIGQQVKRIDALPADVVTRQCYLAMGFSAPVSITGGLMAMAYLIELRSGKTVHPTLRKRSQQMARAFMEQFPTIPLHADMDPDDWDAKRGTQTIMTTEGTAISD